MPSVPRHRLWVGHLETGSLVASDEQAHYLLHVLRLTRGDGLCVVAGDGYTAVARLADITGETVTLEVGPLTPTRKACLELTVAVPTPKGERADWLVEKLTELGVARIAWIVTARTVVIAKPGGQRAERWQRLAQAAAQQSGSALVPAIAGPLALGEILQYQATTRYIAARGGVPLVHQLAVAPPMGSAIMLLGPEGGLTDDEVSQARHSGYQPVGLGLHILRMETAALAGAAMLLCAAADTALTASGRPEA
jgi:16S rRNA (uracil1498-N3)-methyltransferase